MQFFSEKNDVQNFRTITIFEVDFFFISGSNLTHLQATVDSRYLEFQGAPWNTSRYPYLEISELQKWGKQ